MRTRIVLGVAGAWLLVALVWASQTVLAGNLQGNAIAWAAALRTALLQTVPWIPVTLAIVALAHRFPVTRTTWRRALPVHVLAFPLLLYVENALVVAGYGLMQGSWPAPAMLLRGAATWTLLRLHVGALVYAAIAAVTQAVAYYRASRARELRVARLEGQLARARLDALTAQIRPHFLFNTLHTIGQLWRSGRADAADAMLDHLGALFQRVRQTTTQPLVTVDEELDMVEDYLAIETARFPDRLRVVVEADDAARACTIPPLLLQPLVENAIRHGIAPTSSAGRVAVTASVEGGRLVIDVCDDGRGFRDGAAVSARPAATRGSEGAKLENGGTGLANTRERIAQMYGDDHRLDIHTSLDEGTRIRIDVPARTSAESGIVEASAASANGRRTVDAASLAVPHGAAAPAADARDR